MGDTDRFRRDQPREKRGDESREGNQGKDKADLKATNLSLAEIMSLQEKDARVKDQLQRSAQAKDASPGQKDKSGLNEYSSFDILSLLGFSKALGGGAVKEFKWLSGQVNFFELPKQFGRKFLQLKKAELITLKELEAAKEDDQNLHKQALKAGKDKKDIEEPKPIAKQPEKTEAPVKEDDKKQEDEMAVELEVERIYDEKDYVEEIKRATELSLGIDEAHTEGRQVFKDLEKIHPHDMGARKAPTYERLCRKRLRECIKNLSGGKVIVVGDLLIDELLEGNPERISREAPVLILEHVETELIPGGAGNTAHNITALGGVCHAIGVCGKDEYAEKLASLLDKYHITHSLVQDPSRPTTVKTRILSKSHAIKQQLLRLDRISHATIDSAVQSLLAGKLESIAAKYKAIIMSDYRAGVITDGIIDVCKKVAAQQKLLLVVDAQENFARFQNATLLTPNQPDAEKAIGFTFDSKEDLWRGGEALLLLTGAQAILITCGPAGMVLFRKGQAPFDMPAFNRSDVFDVTGAGDTVVATMTLALVTGASFEEAMALGNLAAGIVVRKPGTAVTTQKELTDALELIPLDEE